MSRHGIAFALLLSLPGVGASHGQDSVTDPVAANGGSAVVQRPGDLTAVWANDGGDKVTKSELRASAAPGSVRSSVWDGHAIRVFAARNEVVSFNVVLESAIREANGVGVAMDPLVGPGGATIASVPATGDGVFDWTQRPVELFFVRYLRIEGLSLLAYNPYYDERHVPERFRRPWVGEGVGAGTWSDRPDHDRLYPDIAVPLELVGEFDVPAGESQSVWVDVYVPKASPAGVYGGRLLVREGGVLTHVVPVELRVLDFTLPDVPSCETMLAIGYADINRRYLGLEWPCTASQIADSELVRDRHFQVAHRHRLALVDRDLGCFEWNHDRPRPEWLPRLDGSLFTAAEGYAGPGEGVGNGIYSIGLWGTWPWQVQGEAEMWQHADAWETWFSANAPSTHRSLYLADESADFPQLEEWSSWMNANPGPGSALPSMATIQLPTAQSLVPSLDVPTSARGLGPTSLWQSAADAYLAAGDKELWFYNGYRPLSGSFAIEDDGVALRALVWHQFKLGIDRWFFWEATYYNNLFGGIGQTNVFQRAQTFGASTSTSPLLGKTGLNYGNGDGVLLYPGTDEVFPEESYGVMGPFASLRMKHWRRGLQDGDYLTLARAVDPAAVEAILETMVPEALWEYGVGDDLDPTWVLTDISWSTDPTAWEAARQALAAIIEGP